MDAERAISKLSNESSRTGEVRLNRQEAQAIANRVVTLENITARLLERLIKAGIRDVDLFRKLGA